MPHLSTAAIPADMDDEHGGEAAQLPAPEPAAPAAEATAAAVHPPPQPSPGISYYKYVAHKPCEHGATSLIPLNDARIFDREHLVYRPEASIPGHMPTSL